ncbi:hypothetical protein SE17_03945 [Kouleothrix aurantiaca]|uniref:Uncharacterized protein n=1 Tax=Kouleothrix aurantiaca TaxID=186479 RepID=A0A0P9HHV7_9CHLR|nr:hypothetical protein SE17_03945 [Kouleothrix aurantiaca]
MLAAFLTFEIFFDIIARFYDKYELAIFWFLCMNLINKCAILLVINLNFPSYLFDNSFIITHHS